MTENEIELVRRTYARAVRIGPLVTATFYAELFAIDPSLRALFRADMVSQGEKLLAMFGHITERLHDFENLRPTLRDLAVRHRGYGVEPRHYAMVGVALLRTLKHELASDFTPEARAAWTVAYQRIADTMRQAAYGSAVERQA
jgi:hemoglobin-like flavoprotein